MKLNKTVFLSRVLEFAFLLVIVFSLCSCDMLGLNKQKEYERVAEALNKTLPQRVDQLTTFDSLKVAGDTLKHYYTVDVIKKGFEINNDGIENIKNALLGNLRKSNNSEKYLKYKPAFKYLYLDKQGAVLFDITIVYDEYKQ